MPARPATCRADRLVTTCSPWSRVVRSACQRFNRSQEDKQQEEVAGNLITETFRATVTKKQYQQQQRRRQR